MAITRRDFIKGAVATGALAPTLLNLPFVDAAPTNEWAFENHIPSVCTLCPGGCGIKVRQFKKKAIRIYGNSMHPISLGGLCPRGVAGVQTLYNPDRIRYPMTQKKGSGKWEKISWDEAIKIVSEKLAGVRSKGEPHTLVAFAGQLNGLMRSLAEKFLKIYGSPNFIDVNPTTKPDNAIYLMQGIESAPAYDIAKSAYVLSLNGDFLDNGVSPVHMMKSYAEMRSRINKQRGKLVYAGPRLSITAAKADEWIPIKPGTEGALALGIAHSILKERLYAENFINSHTTGFADWVDETGKTHDGFRTVVFRDYSPIAVSDITGVPPEIIINMARELTRLKPAVVIGSDVSSFNYQSVYTRMAIHSLNALVGNIDTAGSVLIPRPFPSFPEEVELDQTAKNGLAMPSIKEDIKKKHPLCLDASNFIPQRCLGGIPYKPSIILLFETNPVYDNIYAGEYKQLLSETDFVVSFSSFLDETTQYADIVLPNHTYLERWGDSQNFTNGGVPVLGLQQPVVTPFYDTRHTGDVLLEIGQNLGESFRKIFPDISFKKLLMDKFKKVFESSKGNVFGVKYEAAWTQLLERSGWKAYSHTSFDDFWQSVLQRGGWWDPIYYYGEWNRVFKTDSRKFEFAPLILGRTLSSQGTKDTELQNLPHFEPLPSQSSEVEYPLMLNIYTPLVFNQAIDSNVPWLQDISGSYINSGWNTWVEVNPETAERLKIHNGDRVVVESPKGKISATAKVFNGVMPNVVSLPFGMGRRANGRWQRGIGDNPLEILDKAIDQLTGETIWNSTRVKIYKI